jgi:genome maintenance exonuclease 1
MHLFEHEPISLGYEKLDRVTSDDGRVYTDPEGKPYPSVTTVLSILSEEGIQAWRARVGEEEANRISRKASTRGTAVHNIIEHYVANELQRGTCEIPMPHIMDMFYSIKPTIDKSLSKVYCQEAPLYSKHLGLAGTVDCVGVWNGKNSVIDWKTSKKLKKKEWISGYFMQCAAYAIMWEERTGMPITQLVVGIAVDNESPQVFIAHRDDWDKELIKTINEYKRRKIFGRK